LGLQYSNHRVRCATNVHNLAATVDPLSLIASRTRLP